MLLRNISMAAAVAVVGASVALAPLAAQAAPVFTDAETHLDSVGNAYTYDISSGTDCSVSYTGGAEPDVPIVENGPVASASSSISATYADAGNLSDNASGSGTTTATGSVKSSGGSLTSLDFSAQISGQLSNPMSATSDCGRSLTSGVLLEFEFTVAQAGILHLSTANTGDVYAQAYVYRTGTAGDLPYFSDQGRGLKFNTSNDVYLPPGTYRGYFQAEVDFYLVSATKSGTTTVHAQFAVAGSRTAVVSGKGKRYVSFPSARSCATDDLVPSITAKKRRAEDVKQVKFFVNDKLVKKVNTPDKGDIVKLPVADDVSADVRVEVTLFPARRGSPAKVLQASTSYEACS